VMLTTLWASERASKLNPSIRTRFAHTPKKVLKYGNIPDFITFPRLCVGQTTLSFEGIDSREQSREASWPHLLTRHNSGCRARIKRA